MKGDFSRETFDPKKHYNRVLMQQGRVLTDADWNEQQEIIRYREEVEAVDVIGSSGAPSRNAGFGITAQGKKLLIGAGRMYVDGILVENEADALDYAAQPDLPLAPDAVSVIQKAGATAGIVYLDVWLRHLTALDDPSIRETALGGPDTTTRARVIWQVKVLPVKSTGNPDECQKLKDMRQAAETELEKLIASGGNPADIAALQKKIEAIDERIKIVCTDISCSSRFSEWDTLSADSSGMLNARSSPLQQTGNECQIPPSAGYTRLENQLYRVEVHRGGQLPNEQVTFKWSRDNGTVVTLIENVNGQEVKVREVGPDDILGFANGQYVEVVDDTLELAGTPGELIQIVDVNASTRVIRLKSKPMLPFDATRHPKLRRWDSQGDITASGSWQALESGVEVQFANPGLYRAGDYWTIPARTATGDVEWPRDPQSLATVPQARRGIKHHYARLALLGMQNEGLAVLEDCRCIFQPLCSRKTEEPQTTGLHVTRVSFSDGSLLTNGALFDATRLARGLYVTFDGPVSPGTVSRATFTVTIELPWPVYGQPLGKADTEFWKPLGNTDRLAIVGFQPVVLAADISLDVESKNIARWIPLQQTVRFLAGFASVLQYSDQKAVLARLALKGNFIWSADNPEDFLDGESFASSNDANSPQGVQLPSGDGRRGGDFEMWFWLTRQ